jgi:hypothetical protein
MMAAKYQPDSIGQGGIVISKLIASAQSNTTWASAGCAANTGRPAAPWLCGDQEEEKPLTPSPLDRRELLLIQNDPSCPAPCGPSSKLQRPFCRYLLAHPTSLSLSIRYQLHIHIHIHLPIPLSIVRRYRRVSS